MGLIVAYCIEIFSCDYQILLIVKMKSQFTANQGILYWNQKATLLLIFAIFVRWIVRWIDCIYLFTSFITLIEFVNANPSVQAEAAELFYNKFCGDLRQSY